MASRKRKLLNLEQRVNVVKQHDKGVSCRAIAKSLDVGKTQVQGIINDRAQIMNLWDNGASSGIEFLKVRKTVNHEVNSKMWDFFWNARSKNIPLTSKLLQEQAIILNIRS